MIEKRAGLQAAVLAAALIMAGAPQAWGRMKKTATKRIF